MNTTPTLPAATRGRRRVTQNPSGDGWQVTYTCEWEDYCRACEERYPCPTVRALGGEGVE